MFAIKSPHLRFVADKIAENFPQIEFVHLADATGEKILGYNLKKVGLLGTKYTMELDFYKNRLNDMEINVVVPKSKEIGDLPSYVKDLYMNLL